MSEYGNISKEELDQARYFLAGIKNQKLIEVAHKHTNDMLRFHDVRRHMNGEVQEFKNIAYSMEPNSESRYGSSR